MYLNAQYSKTYAQVALIKLLFSHLETKVKAEKFIKVRGENSGRIDTSISNIKSSCDARNSIVFGQKKAECEMTCREFVNSSLSVF